MHNIYDKLINKVIKTTSLLNLKRVDTDITSSKPKDRFTLPFITISREPGSGGKPVARLIAKWLNFDLYDKKLLTNLAKNTKKRATLLKSLDEHATSVVDDIIHSLFDPDYVSDIEFIKALSSVVLSAALKGEVIILGRGANFITPFDKGLNVRISAPYIVRVERAVKYENISREKAMRIIRKIDKKRKEYISHYFNKDISNTNYYDLVINTEDMSIQDAAEQVVLALKNKFPEYAKKRRKLFAKLLLTF